MHYRSLACSYSIRLLRSYASNTIILRSRKKEELTELEMWLRILKSLMIHDTSSRASGSLGNAITMSAHQIPFPCAPLMRQRHSMLHVINDMKKIYIERQPYACSLSFGFISVIKLIRRGFFSDFTGVPLVAGSSMTSDFKGVNGDGDGGPRATASIASAT